MSSSETIEQLQAEADYYRDRVALLRAKAVLVGPRFQRACDRSNGSLSADSGAVAKRGCARSVRGVR